MNSHDRWQDAPSGADGGRGQARLKEVININDIVSGAYMRPSSLVLCARRNALCYAREVRSRS